MSPGMMLLTVRAGCALALVVVLVCLATPAACDDGGAAEPDKEEEPAPTNSFMWHPPIRPSALMVDKRDPGYPGMETPAKLEHSGDEGISTLDIYGCPRLPLTPLSIYRASDEGTACVLSEVYAADGFLRESEVEMMHNGVGGRFEVPPVRNKQPLLPVCGPKHVIV